MMMWSNYSFSMISLFLASVVMSALPAVHGRLSSSSSTTPSSSSSWTPLNCSLHWLPQKTSPGEQFAIPAEGFGTSYYADGLPSEKWIQWQENLTSWREEVRTRVNFSGEAYDPSTAEGSALQWIRGAFLGPQMHPFDRFFFNESSQDYIVDHWLKYVEELYGGNSEMMIWPTYPNIGVDDRSQFEWFESLPGGLTALKTVISQLHNAGIRVLLPYNPWDTGTRPNFQRTTNLTVQDKLALLAKLTGADGIQGDTMEYLNKSIFTTAQRSPYNLAALALEPELGGSESTMDWNTMNWAYWAYPTTPCIDTLKYLNRRRMTQVCNRWAINKTDDVQYAFLNGDGYVPWQNVWGTWNGITPRSASLIKRYSAMVNFFHNEANILPEATWYPMYPVVNSSSGLVFASRWRNQTIQGDFSSSTSSFLFFLVNRGPSWQHDVGVNISSAPFHYEKERYDSSSSVDSSSSSSCVFDCYWGKRLNLNGGDIATVSIEPWGLGCLIVLPEEHCNNTSSSNGTTKPSSGFYSTLLNFLTNTMQPLTSFELEEFSPVWNYLPQTLLKHAPSTDRVSIPPSQQEKKGTPPVNMKAVPPPEGDWDFYAEGMEIEGGPYSGVDFQYPWETYPRRHHKTVITEGTLTNGYWMDQFLVTNKQWQRFLIESGFQVADTTNYLRFWQQYGSANPATPQGYWTFKPGTGDQPVTWVSPAEADAYCRFYGKRLPSALEWQFAAQGLADSEQRNFPWGWENVSTWKRGPPYTPYLYTGNDMPLPPNNVTDFPASASPYGIEAMVGLVWQWTDNFQDDHTRTQLIVGGSYYRPSGSLWYLPHAIQVWQHQKYLKMADTYDRSGTVGFRCVLDVPDN